MNELIIERLEYLKSHSIYLADCIMIKGNIVDNDIWLLKDNPEVKIMFKSPSIIKNNSFKKDRFVYYTIFKPDFDLALFNTPTNWIKN